MDADQQRNVEADTNKHIRVTACPGAGKSRTLVQRVIQLVTVHKIHPSKIRVVTFSRQASADVSTRLPDGVKSSTIHSFCLELAEAFDPVLRRARFQLPNTCPWSKNGEVLESCFMASEKETFFSNAESEVFLPDEHIYRLLRAFQATVDDETADSIRSLVPHFLLVDEAQDLDRTQFDVIWLLVERYATRVFAVGDVNQNIYAFRMSDAKLLEEVVRLETYPSESFELLNNYRSTEGLVAFCNEIRPNRDSHPMHHMRDCVLRPPKLGVFEDRGEELRYVAERVASHALETNGDLGEIAIIARTQREVYTMAHKLTEMGYSTRIYAGESEPTPGKRMRHSSDEPITLCTMHGAKVRD
jgi:superfamily I DNA/RNA helicase